MSKLITFAVPCYNSAAYMDHCVRTPPVSRVRTQ